MGAEVANCGVTPAAEGSTDWPLLLSSAEQEEKGRCVLCVDGRGYIGWAILRQPYSI